MRKPSARLVLRSMPCSRGMRTVALANAGPAITRIQRTLNLGRSSVKRYLHRLEAAGLITVEERWSEEGDRTSNLYTLLNPEPAAIAARHQTTSAAPTLARGDCEG